MEPVFMICGESAGIAAAQAISENVIVRQIDQGTYQKKLMEYAQRLEWWCRFGIMSSKQVDCSIIAPDIPKGW